MRIYSPDAYPPTAKRRNLLCNRRNTDNRRTGSTKDEDAFVGPVLCFICKGYYTEVNNVMDDNGKYISILEASQLSGKHIATIYRAIRNGKLNATQCEAGATQIKKVRKSDITRLFINSCETDATQVRNYGEADCETLRNLSKDDIRQEMKKVIAEYFQDRETQMMKPMEEMAIFKVGKLEAEKLFLKDKVDTLLQELEAYRALPSPPGDVIQKLEQTEAEKVDLATQLEIAIQVKQNALKEKEKTEQMLQEKERTIKEGEEQIRKLEEQRKELEIRLKAESEEQMKQLAEVWKKELEQAQRPWWKFW